VYNLVSFLILEEIVSVFLHLACFDYGFVRYSLRTLIMKFWWRLFLHLYRWCGFCLWFCLCVVSHKHIELCMLYTILTSLLDFLSFFSWWNWGLNLGLCISKAGILLLEIYLQSILFWLFWRWGSHELFCLGWHQAVIFSISASQVARITGVSLWCLATTKVAWLT
jgi:hypothetical protein